MLRNGIDMIAIERIRKATDRHGDHFLRKLFTENERQYCGGKPEALAARFAAKEAAAKVLGTGIGPVNWTDLEVINDVCGRPELHFHGEAANLAEELGFKEWSLSLSHTDELAIASVVAMG